MSKRQPALSTQLKAATARIEELEKKLKVETSAKDSFYKMQVEKGEALEQVHALLDVLPGAVGRKSQTEQSWNRKDLTLMTRLASYFANCGAPSVKIGE